MSQKSTKKGKGTTESIKWDKEVLKKDVLKMANISAADEAELTSGLSDLSHKQHAEDISGVWQDTQLMSALWGPYMIRILKQLLKKGVDVDSMRNLIDQIILAKDSTAPRERLLQMISEQRPMILEAMSKVVDVEDVGRQMQTIFSAGKQASFSTASVLVLVGRKE